MRLLNTKTLTFKDFWEDEIPLYAILSHMWGSSEVETSYQDFLADRKRDCAGYTKIRAFCRYAASQLLMYDFGTVSLGKKCPTELGVAMHDGWVWIDTYQWVWIDTCCIDKSSSAELSEAINSMYQWYEDALVCIVYLDDVDCQYPQTKTLQQLLQSRWFTRGWTLQELLAPDSVVFVDRNWIDIGNKQQLASELSTTTGISRMRLSNKRFNPGPITQAEKMGWVGTRRTTRREDQAYCLLGLFNINMPLLYGERNKAFKRLQLEIITSSDDESIFVWQTTSWDPIYTSILARAPECFRLQIKRPYDDREFSPIKGLLRHSYSVSNKGLEFRVPSKLISQGIFLFPLNCRHYEEGVVKGVYAIVLYDSGGVWLRAGNSRHGQYDTVNLGRFAQYELPGKGSLYIVPVEQVWSRRSLQGVETDIIYVSTTAGL